MVSFTMLEIQRQTYDDIYIKCDGMVKLSVGCKLPDLSATLARDFCLNKTPL